MDMNQPAPHNPVDDNRNGLIGQPLDRVDGRLKVTGRAPYAYEVKEAGKPAYGFIVEAGIARGRITEIDTREAEALPGVLLVMTYLNAPRQPPYDKMQKGDRFARARPQLADDQVRHYGQPVAFVVAESFEQARFASQRLRVRYAADRGEYDLQRSLPRAEKPDDLAEKQPDSAVGDFDTAFVQAPVKIDARYVTPYHIHAQMEPHAALAFWQGDRLTVHCSAQLLESAQKCVATTLQVPEDKVRIVSRYIGGGFGGKLPIHGEVILSAMAARRLQRPVKTALTRQQMFHVTTHRSETVQRVRLGANTDGRLTAIAHEAWSHSARFDDFYESAAQQTRSLYAAAHRMTQQRRVPLDLPVSDSTRAPGEAVGMLAIEVAMDELAEHLRLDPIELRTGSYTVFTQIAAELLGLPPEKVSMQLGDSDFPPTAGSGGSFGAASAGSALYDACMALRGQLAAQAGVPAEQAVFSGGNLQAGGRSLPLARLAGRQGLEADGEIQPGTQQKQVSQQAYGAHFAEVSVDMDIGEIRLQRMLGVFAAGRILNMKTALSQAVGGMVWGVGSALTEEGVLDTRHGFFANHDLAEYHVPVHADIPAIEAVFLPEVDAHTNPLKIKGVGELGICGAGAAIANAIYNACGVRLREYPMTLDKVLRGLNA